VSTHLSSDQSAWSVCRDAEHGFSLRYPADWTSVGPPGRCVQFQRGEPSLPDGVPEVDVFIRVLPLEGDFPSAYLAPETEPTAQRIQVGHGVTYTDRTEAVVNGLPAVRARFRSSGPTPNWGVEYAVRKGDFVLDVYVSRPTPEVEAEFEQVIATLEW